MDHGHICIGCNKPFNPSKVELKRGGGKCCSRSCSAIVGNKLRYNRDVPRHPCGKRKRDHSELENDINYLLAHRIGRIRARSARNGIECTITTKDLVSLWKRQNGKCFYSGENMVIEKNCSPAPNQMSVDRMDPNKGYTLDNIALCSYWLNAAKQRMPIEELMTRCKTFVDFNLTKSLSQ